MHCGAKQELKQTSRRTKRANGTGSVIKRGSGYCAYYTVNFSEEGVQRRKYKYGFKTRAEAIEWLEKRRYVPEKKSLTLKDLYELYSNKQMPKLSKDKQTHYRTAWKRLAEISGRTVDSLTISEIQQAVDDKVSTHYPAKDIKDLLSNLYELAMAERAIEVNLSRYIVLPDNNEEEAEAFTEDEILMMWEDYESGHTETGYYLVMLHSGMMPGEMRKLIPANINLDERIIHGCGLKTKKRKETPLGIANAIIPVINDLLPRIGKTGRFYPKDEKTFYRDFNEMIKRIGANPKLTPYSCRHTFATVLTERNVDPDTLREAMRHTSFKTTKRYIHTSADQKVLEAVNKI